MSKTTYFSYFQRKLRALFSSLIKKYSQLVRYTDTVVFQPSYLPPGWGSLVVLQMKELPIRYYVAQILTLRLFSSSWNKFLTPLWSWLIVTPFKQLMSAYFGSSSSQTSIKCQVDLVSKWYRYCNIATTISIRRQQMWSFAHLNLGLPINNVS